MTRFIAVGTLIITLCTPLSAMALTTIHHSCAPDPFFSFWGVQVAMGRCQAQVALLLPGEAAQVAFTLPLVDIEGHLQTCFPQSIRGYRISQGPGLDARAPAGVWVTIQSVITGEITFYIKNDSGGVVSDLWVGVHWGCF